jgi:putative peptide zinc metalloprotease protein
VVAAAYPKLRDDLITSRQETPEGIFFVIKDPARRRFFRFREPEHLIARQLDGSTSLEALQHRIERELGSSVSPEILEQFIEQLRRLDLLQTDQPVVLDHTPLHRRVAGSPLYVRLKALDPDRLFSRLVGKVWFFFTPAFVALSAAIFIAAVAVTISNWDEFVRDVIHLYRFDAFLLAWMTMLLVTTAHEFAHGLTCKRFGGEVHEIGFLLLYFQPAFYCNISDAWLFPEKSRRLWVTFAGAYLEMFVWSLATLTWWITDTDNWVSFLALIVMATSGIKSIFNMNPLIKLDGYYLLSDYLGVPNLRQRSMSYLKAAVKRLSGSKGEVAAATPRERRICLIYGVLATTYSFWLLGWVALRFGNYLVDQYQGPGFLAFSGLLMVVFRNPLSSAATRLPAPLRRRPDALARLRRPAVRTGLLVAALAALFLVRLELKVPGEFIVRPVRNADVHAAVDGTIEQVYVKEGDRVRAGDVLLRLSERDYRAELGKVEAGIAEKRATLKMLRAGPTPEEVGLTKDGIRTARTRHDHARHRVEEAERIRVTRLSKAEATARAAEERLQYTSSDRNRLKELFAKGLISRKQLDDAEQEVALRERELEVAQAERLLVSADTLAEARQELAVTQTQMQEAGGKLKLLLAGARPETVEMTEAEIARLETERRYLADQVRLTMIVSPTAGVVTTPKLEEKVGEHVKQGDLILKVFELDTITPEVAISEKEIAEVKPGQQVVLKARAYPGRSFTGTVKAIAPAAIEDTGVGRKVFRVTIAMNEGSDLLKPEMTGNAKVL